MEKKNVSLFPVFSAIFRIWKRETLKRLFSFRHLAVHMFRAKRTRKKIQRKEGLLVPTAIALSPTSNCNLNCLGCYSRSHPQMDQLRMETIDHCIGEAVNEIAESGNVVPVVSVEGDLEMTDTSIEYLGSETFIDRLIEHLRTKPIVLINLPEDEYGEAGYCMAVDRAPGPSDRTHAR